MPYDNKMEESGSMESGNFMEDAMSKAKEMGMLDKPQEQGSESPKLMIGDQVMEGEDIVKFVDENREMLLGGKKEEGSEMMSGEDTEM